MAKYYSVGTSDQFAEVNLPPKLVTNGSTGFVTFGDSSITNIGVGNYRVDYSGVITKYQTGIPRLIFSTGIVAPNFGVYLVPLTAVTFNVKLRYYGAGSDISHPLVISKGDRIVVNITKSNSNVGGVGFTVNGNTVTTVDSGPTGGGVWAISRDNPEVGQECDSFSIVSPQGSFSWVKEYENVDSDPSGKPLNLSSGASWGKLGIVGNYLTVPLAVSAITASNPTEPVIIEVLDRTTDVSGVPATINGQSVTVQYSYAPPIQTGSIFPKCRCTISIGV